MTKRWRVATKDDLNYVVPRLRRQDVEECRAMFGIDPASFFAAAGLNDDTYCIVSSQGTAFGLAGVAKSRASPSVAQIWMVATPKLEDHQMEFLKYSKKFIDEVTAPYDLVYNYVDARNEVHLKWLQWCGFTFINYLPSWGAEKRPFYSFVKVI